MPYLDSKTNMRSGNRRTRPGVPAKRDDRWRQSDSEPIGLGDAYSEWHPVVHSNPKRHDKPHSDSDCNGQSFGDSKCNSECYRKSFGEPERHSKCYGNSECNGYSKSKWYS